MPLSLALDLGRGILVCQSTNKPHVLSLVRGRGRNLKSFPEIEKTVQTGPPAILSPILQLTNRFPIPDLSKNSNISFEEPAARKPS